MIDGPHHFFCQVPAGRARGLSFLSLDDARQLEAVNGAWEQFKGKRRHDIPFPFLHHKLSEVP